MGLKNKRKSTDQGVTSIQNDYVRSVELQEKKQQAHKIRLVRRLSVFGILAAICLLWIVTTMYSQTRDIADKKEEKAEAVAELEAAEDKQIKLEEHIQLLNDEDYLAKLARKEYFLSEEGEIIFSIPENEENEDGKE
ncbi:FtsB family cell division protein [Planococcus lenghuensis]|uniref:Cell division protein DivIVC n=1 Tax=Planococcus lenghuensis TaxID=2213202 RepID=A0A1Q2KVM1_9BACL|nr:septum formation initiator family protein [Planococcus lenghuensis]AQQ51722.1 cell division protein DivIVC [Planococcus lenghuensis]